MIDHPPEDYRIVLCESCGSEGRIYTQSGNHPDDVIDHGECPYCDGTGGEIVPVFPIELADLADDKEDTHDPV